MNNFRLGLVPMTSTDSWEVNLKSCLVQLSFFEKNEADLILFPENSLYFNFARALDADDAFELDHAVWHPLREWAQKHKTYLHLGGVPLAEDGQVFNASVLITPDGFVNSVYKKIHLFDVKVGDIEVSESKSFCAGDEPAVIDIQGWKIGLTICYDIRFAELFLHYHKQEVDLILAPSSFLVPTGQAHWQALLRARAIEAQCFVAAAAQVGEHKSQKFPGKVKQTWGESLAFGPWGDILGKTASSKEDHQELKPIVIELDPSQIDKTRTQIPALSHRKL